MVQAIPRPLVCSGSLTEDMDMMTETQRQISLIQSTLSSCTDPSDPSALTSVVDSVLPLLTSDVVMYILGRRCTPGSVTDRIPFITLGRLVTVCLLPWKPRPGHTMCATALTRALSKHHHRDVSTNRWGGIKGSIPTKNARSLDILCRILRDAVWYNVHQIVHGVVTIEIRDADGYGARWVLENESLTDGPETVIVFRGLLEPHTPDGHDKGWVH
ncbi:hypothetical protein KIPB_007055 [Kipferlia bialata]|uniref:Uncharacterized protein n=1 Tax=Kipferlia bialata TaxID=797122 RepID=A0A9K3CZS1_9EUKA|nr:hypothetical protein KIPB_007055 [Kipferlia bialata]|eukprot:g7055.t1